MLHLSIFTISLGFEFSLSTDLLYVSGPIFVTTILNNFHLIPLILYFFTWLITMSTNRISLYNLTASPALHSYNH